jgi:CheY-like chemotaxis protein
LERETDQRLEEMFCSFPEGAAEEPAMALVADRNPSLRELLVGTLRDRGYRVVEAADGVEARQLVAAHRPAVAVLNAFLPNLLGVTLCTEIKSHPELEGIRVVVVGSLYRRDRFVRDPQDLYGADFFLDGNGSSEEIRKRAEKICAHLDSEKAGEATEEVDDRHELQRLARIVAGDIILYNPQAAEKEIAAGRFFETFSHEIREGEALVASRFPHVEEHRSLYHETLREAVLRHGEAAGIPAQAGG